MQNPGKNYRKLTSSQDDYKKSAHTRLDADSLEPQSHNEAADLSSAAGDNDFGLLFADEPESELPGPWDEFSLLNPVLTGLQPQEHSPFYAPMDFVQSIADGSWAANSSQDYPSIMNMEDIQPSATLIHHNVYPSSTLSPFPSAPLSSPWGPYYDLNSTISPAPMAPFFPNPVSVVPSHCTPCVDQMYTSCTPSVTISQSHSSADVVQRSPVSLCPPTKPRSSSAERKTPSRPKKPSGSIHRCDQCPRTFSRPYNLSSHIKTHSGAKPHACNWEGCKSAFLRPYDLARHERNHSGETPFVCSCGAQFKRHEGLKRHEKSCT